MRVSGLKRLTVAILLASCAGTAWSQYIWLNDKGIKQYSDIPPPASVPDSKIIKSPKGAAVASSVAKADAETADLSEATKKTPETIAEKNADFNKRKTEREKKDKEAEQNAKHAADKKKACEQASNYKRALDSGQRISRTDQSGERAFLSDEDRAQETKNNNRVLNECK